MYSARILPWAAGFTSRDALTSFGPALASILRPKYSYKWLTGTSRPAATRDVGPPEAFIQDAACRSSARLWTDSFSWRRMILEDSHKLPGMFTARTIRKAIREAFDGRPLARNVRTKGRIGIPKRPP